ncbi:UDP-2,3-diacylglucosamine diphosphatase [Pectobacterium atrosepticum]|uniref:UDP-2,3-diacylglucosamine diphosphatase n=1 Tax=Pectobacterium atrosepticum TaxID=29471 RepID=UPI00049B03C5|nr:UDP-2,3-diacylglucosamine diphosphatase [Pectobacterium atrosepticum]GKV84494.1 UDP-2,3-diacylglucosamine hydrolase [Pectobacterium carotovorum subsp. carotovorum]AIA71975.1 UDP-2,3-diacylglucosamine hydrolase [Pectobacterium atrosepticum]AIK14942.1 UDP-2,3-diacylglucosamine hydrolase [Pectobacterium atrosepticum]KFX15054.1 UDP-2,3-diacylglucosamine hydrolase [Pectobacterium atrosepticum]KMK88375.1 UDP-2,3-diacylglucosamine hydrolase [Pectobacterium atrosepticum ICMP 1526]
MATLFIADLHLSLHEPAITAGFLRFLRHEAIHADALYILGDLFDAWIGDDDPQPLHATIAAELYALHQLGIPCYFVHGNRDFLIGKRFARQSGMTLLPTENIVDLYGQKILILHGDTLCTDDPAYQKFRRRVHNPFIQQLFLLLPLSLRLKIAAKMRASSQQANQQKSQQIMDVNPEQVLERLRHYQVKTMIHGHTHRPAIHQVDLGKSYGRRAVLGAWHEEGSMIKVTPQNIELISFPF